MDVLLIEGGHERCPRGVCRRIAECENQFRNAGIDKRMQETQLSPAALCRCALSKRYLAAKNNSDSRSFDAGARRHRARPTTFPTDGRRRSGPTLDNNGGQAAQQNEP